MKEWLHKVEVIVDKLIVPALVALIGILVIDLGFPVLLEEHLWLEHTVTYTDYLIVFIFVLDLFFKYLRSKTFPAFLKSSWIDILAVFPFFIFFRLIGAVAGLFSTTVVEGGQTVQSLLHTGVETEKEAVKVAKEVEKVAKASRSARFTRFLRPILRLPRFLKAGSSFYAEPHGKHWKQNSKKDAKIKKKQLKK
jgi:hypothetical protein